MHPLLALTHTAACTRSKGVGTREAWVWGPSRVFAPRLAPTAAHRFLSAALHALHRHPPPPRQGVQLSFLPRTPFRSTPRCNRVHCTGGLSEHAHTYRATGSCRGGGGGRLYALAGGRGLSATERGGGRCDRTRAPAQNP